MALTNGRRYDESLTSALGGQIKDDQLPNQIPGLPGEGGLGRFGVVEYQLRCDEQSGPGVCVTIKAGLGVVAGSWPIGRMPSCGRLGDARRGLCIIGDVKWSTVAADPADEVAAGLAAGKRGPARSAPASPRATMGS